MSAVFLRDQSTSVTGGGGGSSREGLIQLPAAFAADFYLNGEKVAELTLRPVKGGMSLA